MSEPGDTAQAPRGADLRRRVLSSGRWVSFAIAVRAVIQLVQVMVLARLLAPADFGTMALVVAAATFAQIFADAGVSNAIISVREISAQQRSSLYWLNMAAGVAVALALAAAGPWMAAIYDEPVLQPLAALAGLQVVLGASWQQLRVLAEKELRFAVLAGVEIAASALGLAAALALAWAGAGVYALMGALLASTGASAALAWAYLRGGYAIEARLRLAEIREFLAFGRYVMANDLANAFNSNIDVVLGGKLLGTQAIGFYSIPKGLCLQAIGIINPIITRIGLPVMAHAQDDPRLLKRVYLQAMNITGSSNFPVFVAIAAFAPELTRLVLGPQWEAAIPLLRLFAVWALIRAVGNPVGSLLMARGRADLALKWNLAWIPACAVFVWAGSRHGAQGLAIAVTALAAAAVLPNWHFLVRPLCGASFGEYFRELAVPLALALAAGMAALLAATPFEGSVARLAVGLTTGALAYLALSYFFNRPTLTTAREILNMRRTGR